jgi:hypothetical protein
MNIIFNDLYCRKCKEKIFLCEGDILQIIQENLDSLVCECEKCEEKNEIELTKAFFSIGIINHWNDN